VCGPAVGRGAAQAQQSATAQLLGKAHALEQRGRIDMAKQTWQQVLLVDPNNSEALAGMARAAKLEGKNQDAARYLDKLRSLNPNDPNIARVENMESERNTSTQLNEAGKLAQAGQYARAMTILRQVYGDTPPPGDTALSYYQTEAATMDGRPHAIAGLRALVQKFTQDSRYQIALGKILTYDPRTRAEGRKLLQRFPEDVEASEALRQSLVWDAQNPATAADIRSYLAKHNDQQLASALTELAKKKSGGPTLTAEQRASQASMRARTAEDNAAYADLNAHRVNEAETRFKEILSRNPRDSQALAGMGYVRMEQANFGGAISFLEQAEQEGAHDPGVEKALRDSRFYYTMQEATAALDQNDLGSAQFEFDSALKMRPDSAEAMLGLGGTLLKAQQPQAAMRVFSAYVKMKPGDKAAWRGLFMAQAAAGLYSDALAMDKRVPPAVRAQLLRDPDYLRTLASVYTGVGRDADAQRVLQSALDLPFPADARGIKADTQLQYAGLLAAAKHYEQASGLYRQVLAADTTNTSAWTGLIGTEHALGQDANALQAVSAMPPQNYQAAMQEPGFETLVASIYQGLRQMDQAQELLERFLAAQRGAGKKPFVPAELQLAAIYLTRGNSQQAYPLYREALSGNTDNIDAWKGLLSTLHSTGHDQEALAQVQQIPAPVRKTLEGDPAYLQTVGSIYAGLGQPQAAMQFLNRIQQHYAAERTVAPADVDIQNAWLLFNSQNDAALYRSLMGLGSRPDLTDEQRRTVQTIWATWAVRRSNQAAQAGNTKRALAILNAAAQAFPDNAAVTKALATGYAAAGMPKQAVAIFKAQDLSTGTAADYKAAIGAALADNDLKDAEVWLRFGLDQYPRDAQMLVLGAKFEQARGDANRAAEYYKASLAAMPPVDYGADLASEMSRAAPVSTARRTNAVRAQDLATLLSAPEAKTTLPEEAAPAPVYTRPYLPGSTNSTIAPVPLNEAPPVSGGVPVYNVPPGYPGASDPGAQPQPVAPKKGTKLKDYVPESKVGPAPMDNAIHLHPVAAIEKAFGPYTSYDPSVETAAMAQARLDAAKVSTGLHAVVWQQAQYQQPVYPQPVYPQPAPAQPTYVPPVNSQPAPQQSTYPQPVYPQPVNPQTESPAGTYKESFPVPRNSGAHKSTAGAPKSTPDGTPIVPYAGTAAAKRRPTASEAARARAAAIRANQQTAPLTLSGVSHPPEENYDASQLDGVQFNPAQTQGTQIQRPQSQQTTDALPNGSQQPVQTGDSNGQQYPQPNTRGTQPVRPRRRTTPAPAPQQAPVQQSAPPITYPPYGQPQLTNPGPPATGQAYPLPEPPSDSDLIQHNVPPLRGYYDPRVDPKAPLNQRQQTELDLAIIEGSYSGWVGGTAYGRYRSGTPGIDRLTALEAPFEVSGVASKTARFTIIPKGVFLNSGVLNTQGGGLGTQPVLGTLPGNALNPPQQQFATGVGGEIQMTTRTLGLALGYTPYGFLVSNVIGRARWKPGNGHFTLFGGRDAVKETQLSYAGLRDPGSAVFGGNIWGGVVESGGGVRFDFGDEKSGFYTQVEGSELTGYHVLENRKYAGTMGAYFRVKTWKDIGTLNVGGTMFGEHYDHNERGQTYGLGGYFSPNAYFLAAVPVTFAGHNGAYFHYNVSGSAGLQTFQENSQVYFPLDVPIQTGFGSNCGQLTCALYPVNSNTGLNYSLDAQGAYELNEHWYVGGFVSGNNTNNYNTISGGFFVRFLFRPQYPTADYPTGLFSFEGFRPVRVP